MSIRLWLIIGAVVSTLGLLGYVGHLRSEVTKQTERAVLAEGQVRALNDVRAQDQQNAKGSYDRSAERCRTDVLAALRGGAAIGKIINAPDPLPGAPRGIIGPDELRDIIGEDQPHP